MAEYDSLGRRFIYEKGFDYRNYGSGQNAGDLSDSSSLVRIIGLVQPDEIYNLAVQSHVQVYFDVPDYSGDVDAICVFRILEAVRIHGFTKKTADGETHGENVGNAWRDC